MQSSRVSRERKLQQWERREGAGFESSATQPLSVGQIPLLPPLADRLFEFDLPQPDWIVNKDAECRGEDASQERGIETT